MGTGGGGGLGGSRWLALDHLSVHLSSLPLLRVRAILGLCAHPTLLLCLQWGICPRLWKMP